MFKCISLYSHGEFIKNETYDATYIGPITSICAYWVSVPKYGNISFTHKDFKKLFSKLSDFRNSRIEEIFKD